jgi:predicted transcriptional regulator
MPKIKLEPKGNAVKKVREFLVNQRHPFTYTDIARNCDLNATEISMALCHLIKLKYAIREQVANPNPKGRRIIWQYTYFPDKIK